MLPDLGTVSGTPGIDEMEAEATMEKLKSCSNKEGWLVRLQLIWKCGTLI